MVPNLALAKGSKVQCERGVYRLERKISEGGMGIIWQAIDVRGGRVVVVKEPHVENGDERIIVERLLLESEVLKSVNDESSKLTSDEKHRLIREHVARYVDRSIDGPEPLLVLEFIDGPTMSDAIRDRRFSQTVAMTYIASLLKVVDVLHSQGIIHRDISPTNIILNPARGIVLIDFGTSQAHGIARKPRYGKVIFKKGFSSPELLQGRSDERSDIFSVGATMFNALTGRNPGDFMSDSQVMTTTVNQVDSTIPRALSEIIETAMSPDPNQRFQSAAAMSTIIEKSIGVTGLFPHIVFGGTVIELRSGFTDIGREHTCDRSCKELGFTRPVHVRIVDPKKFVEKHHARIWVETDGRCLLEDLNSVNRTAIKSKTGELKTLKPFEKAELRDKDIVALAYTPKRGGYVTFQFSQK
jgi:serine/threonine protein kinase